jgi:proteasome accessory factor B
MADGLERVTNLLALLLESRRPLTLDEIAHSLPNYPANQVALRGAFERDKALLRDIGVPVETQILPGGNGTSGYLIDRARYELSGLELTTDERHALQLAVAAVRSNDAQFGLLKLGGSAGDRSAVVANVPELEALPQLREAASARATVSFGYRNVPRIVQPYALLLREGFWYLIGHDRQHDQVRTFRVDRIEGGVTAGPVGSFERPAGFDARRAFPSDPKELGDSAAPRATVLVDAARAGFVADELGAESVTLRHPDGSAEFDVACANLDAFRSWLFGLGTHATVVAPPDVRLAVVSWLRAMAAPT